MGGTNAYNWSTSTGAVRPRSDARLLSWGLNHGMPKVQKRNVYSTRDDYELSRQPSADVVCLVDDDASIRRSITRTLEFNGVRVCAFGGCGNIFEIMFGR